MNEMLQNTLQFTAQELGWIATRAALSTLVVVIAFALNSTLRSALRRRHALLELPAYGQTLILNTVTTSVAVVGCTAILALWGATWSAIATGIGLSTLAIALGLQDVLKSLAGGVVIMLERPFDIGDRIRIRNLEGEVIDIRVRSVVLRMDDNHIAQAPNGLLFSETFENLSRTEAFSYAVVMSGIAEAPSTVRDSILEALQEGAEFARPPDVVIQRDLIPHARWPKRRAIVTWQSENEDASLDRVVALLSHRFPGAQIEIRKR